MIFIAMEGVETAGKTSLMNNLINNPNKFEGRKIHYKREFPTIQCISSLIENALDKSLFLTEGLPFDYNSALFFTLFLESQAISTIDKDSSLVFADRFIDSVIVYQGSFILRDSSLSKYLELRNSITNLFTHLGISLPDITLYLRIDEQTLVERFQNRALRKLTVSEINTIKNFIIIYDYFSNHLPNYYTIDATKSQGEIMEETVEIIKQHL